VTATSRPSAFDRFSALHEGGELLRLANAWDAGSARLTESLGAKAVATTSAGMAWSAGYGDGNRMPPELVVAIARNIARVVDVPVSIDLEGGYSSDPAEVARLAVTLAQAGVAGVNLEDGSEPAELLARKIEATKAALAEAGTDLFVNARTDVYLAGLAEPDKRVAEVLRRAGLYEAAGANGLFVPLVIDLAEMRQIAGGTRLPLNVMAWPGLPSLGELHQAGVRRLSAGAGISARIWAQAEKLTRDFLATGELAGERTPFDQLQQLFP
jgi:2-methylisocitrate lyase-like PEP mutase family enzyme